ncbi:MAG: hypothetical protein RL477_751 [Pseudomonadota bacterium]|jgi:glycosyltransferase involved in cell wall biosynthesis
MTTAAPPFVVAVGPLPPPLQGAAATTDAFVARLAALGPICVRNNALGPGGRFAGSIVKLGRTLRALATILGGAGRKDRTLYAVLDGGLGLAYNLAVVALARALGYRIYLHHHSFAYINARSLLMALLARAGGRTATHVVLCETMGMQLAARYGTAERRFVLGNGGLMAPPDAPVHRPSTAFVFGFLSNLMPEKGVDTAIAVLREARRRGFDCRLALAGPAQGRESEKLLDAARAEFGAAIDITGAIGEDAKAEFFAHIDLFVFPSRYANEAEPRVVIEALRHGVPVLATARGCLPEMIGTDAGAIVKAGEDFAARALDLAARWRADPLEAGRRREAAAAQGRALSADGRRQAAILAGRIMGKNGG